jgi:hypothetical protein
MAHKHSFTQRRMRAISSHLIRMFKQLKCLHEFPLGKDLLLHLFTFQKPGEDSFCFAKGQHTLQFS